MGMEISAKYIIMSAVGFLLVAILTPIAMEQVTGANTTLWETPVTTIFATVLPIVYVIGVAYAFIRQAT